MNLTRWEELRGWDPFRELEQMTNRLNRVFGRPIGAPDGGREALTLADWTPAVNVSETDAAYQIKAELPDVQKENVHITLDKGVLTIQGERKMEKEQKDEKMHRIETAYGSFLRRFTMPEDADATKVDASFKDGMLNVVIPKTEAKKPKKTEIAVH